MVRVDGWGFLLLSSPPSFCHYKHQTARERQLEPGKRCGCCLVVKLRCGRSHRKFYKIKNSCSSSDSVEDAAGCRTLPPFSLLALFPPFSPSLVFDQRCLCTGLILKLVKRLQRLSEHDPPALLIHHFVDGDDGLCCCIHSIGQAGEARLVRLLFFLLKLQGIGAITEPVAAVAIWENNRASRNKC